MFAQSIIQSNRKYVGRYRRGFRALQQPPAERKNFGLEGTSERHATDDFRQRSNYTANFRPVRRFPDLFWV